MKRKLDDAEKGTDDGPNSKRSHVNGSSISSRFHPALFEPGVLHRYTKDYANSQPYKHGIISDLIEPGLLRSVRDEIISNLHFTPKETDIYKIHQSGDLANLDGLDDSSLAKLPSLLSLRDALYSPQFREYLSHITGAGTLSGKKTDMAINVYTPGCHLLCHDDVIGSRRVSYILYLTDPDRAWKDEWGGALRLYPTVKKQTKDGDVVKVPGHAHSVSIPPAFGQLSFFAVQPGESYHDVEEVYHTGMESKTDGDDVRTRMAISGWYHIPQEGEDGYEEGLEERLAEKSSLSQLQGHDEEFDIPQQKFVRWDSKPTTNGDTKGKNKDSTAEDEDRELVLTEKDLDFLLQYISPSFLTPDMTEQLETAFGQESFLDINDFLCKKFSSKLRSWIEKADALSDGWSIAEPPFKHRYCFLQSTHDKKDLNPFQELINVLFPSQAFRKWLALSTGLDTSNLVSHDVIARRFRRGHDYALASTFDGEDHEQGLDGLSSPPSDSEDENNGGMRLEFTLNTTPSKGWTADDHGEDGNGEVDQEGASRTTKAVLKTNGIKATASNETHTTSDQPNVLNDGLLEDDFISPGGEEVYMAADDDDDDNDDNNDNNDDNEKDELSDPTTKKNPKSSDPAIYKSTSKSLDDGILHTNPPQWNILSIVLRDQGTLRFVKYVSRNAGGDRWDIKGEIGCKGVGGEGDDEEGGESEDGGQEDEKEEEGEEWNGILDSDDAAGDRGEASSDSDESE